MFGLDTDGFMRLLYLVLLLAFLGGMFGWRRGRRGTGMLEAARHLLLWAGIMLALVVVYAWREPLLRLAAPVLGELAPSRVVATVAEDGTRELVVLRGGDGHFHLDARADGASVRFMVDTGASSTVLTAADAARAGIDLDSLSFSRPVQTANGRAFSARARLRSLEIGPFRLADVPVAVMPQGALNTSLLGMQTIDRFSRWSIEGDRMVLVP